MGTRFRGCVLRALWPLVESLGRFACWRCPVTQAALARSLERLGQFLADLAVVTTLATIAVIDGFDPTRETTQAKAEYYEDRADGLAYRSLQMEYADRLGESWLYRLFTPDRIRDATIDTS